MCEAVPSDDQPGSMCFARADGQKNPAPNPVHQLKNDRDVGENYKAAANMLRKIQRAPVELRPGSQVPPHETPRSNASFETKHHLPAKFPELLSWGESVAQGTWFCENKISGGSVLPVDGLLRKEGDAPRTAATVPVLLGYAPA